MVLSLLQSAFSRRRWSFWYLQPQNAQTTGCGAEAWSNQLQKPCFTEPQIWPCGHRLEKRSPGVPSVPSWTSRNNLTLRCVAHPLGPSSLTNDQGEALPNWLCLLPCSFLETYSSVETWWAYRGAFCTCAWICFVLGGLWCIPPPAAGSPRAPLPSQKNQQMKYMSRPKWWQCVQSMAKPWLLKPGVEKRAPSGSHRSLKALSSQDSGPCNLVLQRMHGLPESFDSTRNSLPLSLGQGLKTPS